MLKVFVKTDQLDQPTPLVLAHYDSNTPVSVNAHGPGLIVLTVPDRFVRSDETGRQYLAAGWRGDGVTTVMRAEARRRIEEVLPFDQQVDTLHELVAILLKQVGTGHWPPEVQARVAELERVWTYVHDVNQTADTTTSLPRDPTSDVHWPTRIERA